MRDFRPTAICLIWCLWSAVYVQGAVVSKAPAPAVKAVLAPAPGPSTAETCTTPDNSTIEPFAAAVPTSLDAWVTAITDYQLYGFGYDYEYGAYEYAPAPAPLTSSPTKNKPIGRKLQSAQQERRKLQAVAKAAPPPPAKKAAAAPAASSINSGSYAVDYAAYAPFTGGYSTYGAYAPYSYTDYYGAYAPGTSYYGGYGDYGGELDCCPYYLVSVGDTLESIAKMYHIPGGAAWITAYNPDLQTTKLTPGMSISLPCPAVYALLETYAPAPAPAVVASS